MSTCYANACALDSSQEAVEAFFGIDRQLTRRIVFAPAMAKRLEKMPGVKRVESLADAHGAIRALVGHF